MPEKVLIHWVIIKEPNKITKSVGGIYVLIESVEESEFVFLARFFGYRKGKNEPRLHGLDYDRELHERLAKGVMPKLRSGQPVLGKFTKGSSGRRKKGKDNPQKGGSGSESQKQKWEFHELLPSEIHEKPQR